MNIRLSITLLGMALITGACTDNSPQCPIETLILEEALFPSGTHAEPLESPLPEYPSQSAARSFYYAPDSVFQQVVRWDSRASAKHDFAYILRGAFDEDQYRGPWVKPTTLFASSMANDYHGACGLVGETYQCRMVANYGDYSVFFRAEVSEQGITMSNVNDLLRAIDERMAECTGLK